MIVPIITKRKILALAFASIFFSFYFTSLRALFSLSYGSDVYEYILIIPFVSGYFLFKKRKCLVEQRQYSFFKGSFVVLAGMVVWLLQAQSAISMLYGSPSVKILSMVIVFVGGAMCLLGTKVLKNALFPFLFLFLMVPFPVAVMDGIVSFYRSGTAGVADIIFKLSGIAYFRDGLSFHLQGLSIFIALECSGIHSSSALIITGIIAGQLFLRTIVGKSVLILLTIPLVLIKNGIRVAVLSLLGAYVNMSFINGPLHHKGGIVFFLIALIMMFGAVFIIKKVENRQ